MSMGVCLLLLLIHWHPRTLACSGYLGPVFLLPTFTVEKAPGQSALVSIQQPELSNLHH